MKGGGLLPILIAGVTPLLMVGLIIFGSTLGLVVWRPPVFWTSQFGTSRTWAGVHGMTTDNTDAYVAGAFTGNDTFGIPFIRRYDAGASPIWTSVIQNVPQFSFSGVAVGQDGIYAVGENLSSTTLIKYDFSGGEQWGKIVSAGTILAPVSAHAGRVYVASFSSHPVTNQAFTGSVLFVREYDSNGRVVWTSEFSNSSEQVLGISANDFGVYVLTSLSLVGYDLGGNELWLHRSGTPLLVVPSSISADATGLYVSETVAPTPLSFRTGFLTKYALNGDILWNQTFVAPDSRSPESPSLWTDSSGTYLSMGSSSGNGFVEKFDSSGNQIWSFRTPTKPWGDSFLVAAAQGRFYLGGAVQTSVSVEGLVQAFASSSSLVFFGVNPPLSFVALGTVITVAVLSTLFAKMRYAQVIARRPKSASPDRYRKSSPND